MKKTHRYVRAAVFIFLVGAGTLSLRASYTDGSVKGEATLSYFLDLMNHPVPIVTPPDGIYAKEEILFCTGESDVAKANNRAAELMLKGDFQAASDDLNISLRRAPLFLAFHYNLGVCYYHLNDRPRAKLHLGKARMIAPQYYLTDIQMGYLEALDGKDDNSIINYREALHKNPKYLNALVLVGDIYFKRRMIDIASRYYEAVLKITPLHANGLLGQAKILFVREQYYKAYQILKMIDTKGEYDKSLHYYFAECAYKLQDYQTAYTHYTKLLEFKSDRFFVTTSLKLIEHKQELAKRFAQQLDEG